MKVFAQNGKSFMKFAKSEISGMPKEAKNYLGLLMQTEIRKLRSRLNRFIGLNKDLFDKEIKRITKSYTHPEYMKMVATTVGNYVAEAKTICGNIKGLSDDQDAKGFLVNIESALGDPSAYDELGLPTNRLKMQLKMDFLQLVERIKQMAFEDQPAKTKPPMRDFSEMVMNAKNDEKTLKFLRDRQSIKNVK